MAVVLASFLGWDVEVVFAGAELQVGKDRSSSCLIAGPLPLLLSGLARGLLMGWWKRGCDEIAPVMPKSLGGRRCCSVMQSQSQ